MASCSSLLARAKRRPTTRTATLRCPTFWSSMRQTARPLASAVSRSTRPAICGGSCGFLVALPRRSSGADQTLGVNAYAASAPNCSTRGRWCFQGKTPSSASATATGSPISSGPRIVAERAPSATARPRTASCVVLLPSS